MTVLILLNLVLLALLLGRAVICDFITWFQNWSQARALAHSHPEMNDVNLELENLLFFEIDDALAASILSNEQPGSDQPFLLSEQEN
ncbi:MAG: hypothetical protein VKJ31_04025 [Synechococcus sp.]|nr:hypothetical protein [Synechococcus sp.]